MEVNDHILIDDFLNGNLLGSSLEKFNTRMENDVDFKAEVEIQELANLLIKKNERLKIKTQLQQIHNKKTSSSANGRKWWGIGGLIVGLLLSMWYFKQEPTKIQHIETNEDVTNIIPEESNSTRNFGIENKEIETQNLIREQVVVEHEIIAGSAPILEKNEDEKSTSKANLIEPIDELISNDSVIQDIEEKTKTIEEGISEPIVNPCSSLRKIIPNYRLIKPCFGGKEGEIIFNEIAENGVSFSEFSINGGETYFSAFEQFKVAAGTYQIIAKNNLGCISKMKSITVNYADCNFVIQPAYDKYWELDVPEFEELVVLEIRNARNGVLVYRKNIDTQERFIWQGVDSYNNQLNMGNYVYWFKTEQKGVFSKGQITLIR